MNTTAKEAVEQSLELKSRKKSFQWILECWSNRLTFTPIEISDKVHITTIRKDAYGYPEIKMIKTRAYQQ
jgi:hypothetical protein